MHGCSALDHHASMVAHQWFEQLPPQLSKRDKRPSRVFAHQSAVSGHISGQDSGEPSGDVLVCHAAPQLPRIAHRILLAMWERVYRPQCRLGIKTALLRLTAARSAAGGEADGIAVGANGQGGGSAGFHSGLP